MATNPNSQDVLMRDISRVCPAAATPKDWSQENMVRILSQPHVLELITSLALNLEAQLVRRDHGGSDPFVGGITAAFFAGYNISKYKEARREENPNE